MRKWLLVFGVLLVARSTPAQPDNGPGLAAPDPDAKAQPEFVVEAPQDGRREALNKANHALGKLDLSSPENSVRSFVWALTNGDFANTRACVFEPLPNDKLRQHQQVWEREKPKLWYLISDLHSYQDGERATVTLRLTDIHSINAGRLHATSERVHLWRVADKWLILPDGKAEIEQNNRFPEDLLVNVARMLADEKVFPLFQDNASLATCQSNLKQISLGIMQFVQDWDEKFDLHEDWQNQLQPYLRTNAIFLCPNVPANETSYAFNKELENKRFGFPKPHQLIMVYEGKNKTFAYRHQNGTKTNIAFADGHIKAYTREALEGELKAGTVRWMP